MSTSRILRDYVVPPSLWRIAARMRANVRRPANFPQFWTGTTLPAPAGTFGFGDQAGLATATVAGESRVAKRCASGATTAFNPAADGTADYLQFGIAPVSTKSPVHNVRISVDGEAIAQLQGTVPATRWSDIRLPADHANRTVTATFEGNSDIWLSQPLVGNHTTGKTGRNIVVLVIDSMRPVEVGLYPQSGDANPTPFIDGFFEPGIRFENAYSQGEWTLPSLSTMMTGTHAVQHGVYVPYENPRRLPPRLTTLATTLHRAGYRTYCHSNGARFTSAYEHHRGFERFRYTPTTDAQFGCEETIRGGIEFMDAHSAEPFLCFLHFYEAHPPFGPSSFSPDVRMPPQRWAHAYELYAKWKADRDNEGLVQELNTIGNSMIRKLDLHLASLFGYLERSGLLENTTVILTADHGREYVPDLPLLSTDRVHVPLMIRDTRYAPSTRTQFVESGLNILPTALGAAGLPTPDNASGLDLLATDPATDRTAASESLFRGQYELTLRNHDWCYFLRCAMDETTGDIFLDRERDERLFARDPSTKAEDYSHDHGDDHAAVRETFRETSERHATRERFFGHDSLIAT